MTLAVYAFLYVGFFVFVIASAVRAVRYARLPAHLRWELYPVPHEPPERAAHGGSYFEVGNWWQQKQHFHLAGEVKATVSEILLFDTLRQFNRRLWRTSFLFHVGLYLLIGALVLLFLNALLGLATAPYGLLTLALLYRWMGVIGTVAVLAGALGLLAHRLNPEMRNYTAPADIFNLVFFMITVALVALGYLVRPLGSASMVQIVRGLLLFDTSVNVPGILGVGLILAAVLIAYIPNTHMAHYIAKYFTYHSVRWDDTPNTRGSRIEGRFAEYLQYRPTWSAPHLGADGKRTWAEIATSNPSEEVRR